MIAIIDYGAGNLRSVEKALTAIGEESIVTRDRHEILNADKVILPGVGAFGDAMNSLKKYELDKVIHEVCDMDTGTQRRSSSEAPSRLSTRRNHQSNAAYGR